MKPFTMVIVVALVAVVAFGIVGRFIPINLGWVGGQGADGTCETHATKSQGRERSRDR